VASDEHAVITHLPLSGGEYGNEEEREAVFALEEPSSAMEPLTTPMRSKSGFLSPEF
jgi:hypothetical protein